MQKFGCLRVAWASYTSATTLFFSFGLVFLVNTCFGGEDAQLYKSFLLETMVSSW